MQISIRVKQPGRKQALIDNKIIDIDDISEQPTLREFLKAVVSQQVNEYNNKPREKNLLPFLTQSETDEQLAEGKVGFGSIYNENKANILLAKETALQAFEDGMFAVFADEEELVDLSQRFALSPGTVITFIRLTFLAGSYW